MNRTDTAARAATNAQIATNAAEAARETLATAATSTPSTKGLGLDMLAKALNNVAEAEGKAWAWTAIARTLDHNDTTDENLPLRIMLVTSRLMSDGADDRWSGRTNDVARSRYEGVLVACRDAADLADRAF